MMDLAEPHYVFQTSEEQQQSDDTLFLSPQEAET
jgi:hypothetical protein